MCKDKKCGFCSVTQTQLEKITPFMKDATLMYNDFLLSPTENICSICVDRLSIELSRIPFKSIGSPELRETSSFFNTLSERLTAYSKERQCVFRFLTKVNADLEQYAKEQGKEISDTDEFRSVMNRNKKILTDEYPDVEVSGNLYITFSNIKISMNGHVHSFEL